MATNTDSSGCVVGARLWRSPKSSKLVPGQYLDRWPLSRVLAGASNHWAGGWTLRVSVRYRNIDYEDQVSEGMTCCMSTGFPRFPCASCECDTVGGKKRPRPWTLQDIVVAKYMRFGTRGSKAQRSYRQKKYTEVGEYGHKETLFKRSHTIF